VLSHSKADQTEVIVHASESALTRFANSYIHQNVSETNTTVRVRVVYGKKVGVASSNDLAPDALARTVDTARAIAQLQREDPEFRSLPSPQPIQPVEAFVDQTANFTPEQRAQIVGVLCKKAKSRNVVASGALSTVAQEIAVANSLGIFAYHPGTFADISTVMMTDTGSGYASFTHQDVRQVDAEALATEAIEKAIRASSPIAIETGEYTVFLEEPAVLDLLNFFAMLGFTAQAMQEDRSFLKGRLGEKVMDEHVTIWDDGCAPNMIPQPFDFEGVPKQKVTFIEKGIARGVVYDTSTAQREGKTSTGHSLPAPNSVGPSATHVFMAPGATPKSEMVKSIKRGIWVTRFWYTRPVHRMRVLVTGTTRDGTWLIENGQATRPLKNLRFTTSYLDALNHVRAISRETKLFYNDWGGASRVAPAIVVDGFRFTGVTV
jgi:PmbA protein